MTKAQCLENEVGVIYNVISERRRFSQTVNSRAMSLTQISTKTCLGRKIYVSNNLVYAT